MATRTKKADTNGHKDEKPGEVEVEVTATVPQIRLTRIQRALVEVPIIGTAPLIVNRFDEKAKQQMLDAQQSKTRAKKAPKDPQADFERSMYRFPDGGHGFPAVGFKAAMVDSARLYEGVKMTELRACLHILGVGPEQLVRIESTNPPRQREDAVRLAGGGKADLRYRAEYTEWSTVLTVQFVPSMISIQSVFALCDAAGLGGVGEWRPSKAKTGIYGTFEVSGEAFDIEQV
jgi:hypothetical protein